MVKIQFQDNITKANAATFNTMQDNIENGINDASSTLTTYVDNKVLDVYSTTETRIGTYLGKPLYRKVIEYSSTIGTATNVPHGVSNLGTIVSYTGYAIVLNSVKPLPTIYPSNLSNDGISLYDYDATNLHFVLGTWAASNCSKIVPIILYTKTTD